MTIDCLQKFGSVVAYVKGKSISVKNPDSSISANPIPEV